MKAFFKRIAGYLLYIFVAGWMFVLGVMVGRGHAPVHFDTTGFQDRLYDIARRLESKETVQKPIDLKFYDVLDQPVSEPRIAPQKISPKITMGIRTEEDVPDAAVVKIGAKKRTLKSRDASGTGGDASVDITGQTVAVPVRKTVPPLPAGGGYTVQIAAYKSADDAAVEMARLKAKGITSYLETADKDGVVWRRVRSGAFGALEQVRAYQKHLEEKNVTSMIIKKEKP